jgi:hypothetical protein
MTKKIIILTTILLAILGISIGIGFDLSKIKELAASRVNNLTATATALGNDGNQLAQLGARRLDFQVKTKELLSLSGNLLQL